MKTKVVIVLLIISSLSLSYNLGVRKGLSINETCTQNDIAERYIEVIGNPQTAEQQCKFDRVIYNDSTECK